MSKELVDSLRAAVGAGNVFTEPHDTAAYSNDWRKRYYGKPLAVVRPASTAEVSAVVTLCAKERVAIVPQGGNTSLVGGAVPDGSGRQVVLSLARMNKVRAVDTLNNTLTVEAGVVLANVQKAAEDANRLFPLSLAAEGSAMIGGNLSTNAGGVNVLRYGNARALVLGLEVVLPDGRVWDGLRGLRKDNTGYDLKQLFIGAEGTLGVVTAAVLKLFPQPKGRVAAWVGLDSLQHAVELLGCLQESCGERLSSFEVMSRGQLDLVLHHIPGTRDPLKSAHPWAVLLEATDSRAGTDLADHIQDTLAGAMNAGLLQDAAVAASERQVAEFWRLRDSVSEANRNSGYSVSHDTSVPIARIPEFVQRATAALRARRSDPQVVAVGHVGDGNIHLVAIFPRAGKDATELQREADAASAEVHRIAAELGGSISAEHGIGGAKRDELKLYKDPLELGLMQGIKSLLDPGNLMNPGKLLDLPSEARLADPR